MIDSDTDTDTEGDFLEVIQTAYFTVVIDELWLVIN